MPAKKSAQRAKPAKAGSPSKLIDERAFKSLVRAAAALNASSARD